MLFVVELKDGQQASDIDFITAPAVPFSDDNVAGVPYVAAEYDYDTFPDFIVLGDETIFRKYYNARLKSGTRYAYALRSVSAKNVNALSKVA